MSGATLVGLRRGVDDPRLEHARRVEDEAARGRRLAEDAARASAARPPVRITPAAAPPTARIDSTAAAAGPAAGDITAAGGTPTPAPAIAGRWETRSPTPTPLGPTPAWKAPPPRILELPRSAPIPPAPAATADLASSFDDDDPPGPRRLSFERLLARDGASSQARAAPAWVEPWGFEMPTASTGPTTRSQRGDSAPSRRWRPRPTVWGLAGLLAAAALVWGVLPHSAGPPVTGAPLAGSPPAAEPSVAGSRVAGSPAASRVAARSRVEHAPAASPLAASPPVASPTTVAPSSATAYARAEIPGPYMALYVRAASAYHLDWAVLAAIGQIENAADRSVLPAAGGPASPTGVSGRHRSVAASWQRYAVDGDHDGRVDPDDPADAIPTLAAYLRALGAPGKWRQALLAYSHSPATVDAVLDLSRRFDAAAP